jgi:hypothetical protein
MRQLACLERLMLMLRVLQLVIPERISCSSTLNPCYLARCEYWTRSSTHTHKHADSTSVLTTASSFLVYELSRTGRGRFLLSVFSPFWMWDVRRRVDEICYVPTIMCRQTWRWGFCTQISTSFIIYPGATIMGLSFIPWLSYILWLLSVLRAGSLTSLPYWSSTLKQLSMNFFLLCRNLIWEWMLKACWARRGNKIWIMRSSNICSHSPQTALLELLLN